MTDPKTDPKEDAQLSESADAPSPDQIESQAQDTPAGQDDTDGKHGRPSDDSDPGHS
jgi:hypothetical protein